MSKGGRVPTTGGEGQGGGFASSNNTYREPYSNPYRQGGFRVPTPAPVQQPQPQPPMNPSKGGNYGPMPVQQQTGGYNVAGQYDPNMRSGYGTDYMTIGGPLPKSPEPQPTPMSMVRPMPAPAAPQPMSIPVQQPQSAMMPSKGGYNTMPIPLNQSPNITPARQNSSPFGPRNMRYGR